MKSYLRLFGVKQNKKLTKVIINDMRYLYNVGKVTIDRPVNERWYEVAEKHLEKCGFKIIGKVDIPKYDRAYICEENWDSLVAVTNELKEKIK